MTDTKKLQLDVELGKSGALFVTSPDMVGLVVSGPTLEAVLAKVPDVLDRLAEANESIGKPDACPLPRKVLLYKPTPDPY